VAGRALHLAASYRLDGERPQLSTDDRCPQPPGSMPPFGLPVIRYLLLACLSIGACSSASSAQPAAKSVSKIGVAGAPDSCAKLDAAARARGTLEPAPLPPPRAGSWTATHRVTIDAFSLAIPLVARARPRDAHGVYWIDSLPGCHFFCAVDVTLERDSTTGSLESYIAGRRTVDATSNPDAADWIPSPPQYISVGGRRAAIMETVCGDCTSGEVLFFRSGQIARLEYNIDDREGFQPGLVCHLQQMATTFEWNTRPR
jgi:hypothetical protein